MPFSAITLVFGLLIIAVSLWTPRQLRTIGQKMEAQGGNMARWNATMRNPVVRYGLRVSLVCGLVVIAFSLAAIVG